MDIQVDIRAGFCIFLAFLCLTLPLPWLAAAMTAAVIHETCHILAVFLSGGTIQRMIIGVHGAVIDASSLPVLPHLICILAGPAGSLLLALIGNSLPRLALCGLVQGLFNLLPLYPLDGGRALKCVTAYLYAPETADVICRWTERCVKTAIVIIGLWACFFLKLGMAPVAFSLLLLSGTSSGKFPCKEGNLAVQ